MVCYNLPDNTSYYSNGCQYQNTGMSNFRYNGDKFKVDANVNTTGTLCFVGGVAVGAILTYYLLNKCKENKQS